MQKIPNRPDWAPLLINWKRNKTMIKIFIELLLELGCVTCTVIIGTCKLVLEVICESRGLNNLTPSRSRLFKLKGGGKGSEVELQQALAYMVANLRKCEREEKQSTDVN